MSLVGHVAVIIVAISYFVSAVVVALLCYRELKKRQNIQVLSWHAESQKSNNGASNTKGLYLAGSMHYLSIGVYICAIITPIGGIVRALPGVCDWYTLMAHGLPMGTTKAVIYAFQLERYYLCFVKDFINQTRNNDRQGNLRKSLLCFYFVTCFIVIGSIITYLAVIYVFSNRDSVYSLNSIWCTYVTDNAITSAALLFQTILYLLGDWLILLLFFMTIRSLSQKLANLVNMARIEQHSHENNTTATSASSSNSDSSISKSTNIGIDNGIRQGIEKLKWILARILICSIILEITYGIGLGLNSLAPIGTIVWALSYVILSIDNVVNVIMINLMLQHNTKEYQAFIEWLSKTFGCCQCMKGYLAYQYSVDLMKQNGKRSDRPEIMGMNVGVNGDDLTMATGNDSRFVAINDDKFVAEKSYFNSEISKDEDINTHDAL